MKTAPEMQTEAAAPDDGDTVDLSHDALALEMGRRGWDLDAKYCAAWGCWLFWDMVGWRRDDCLLHKTKTREFVRERAREHEASVESKAAAIKGKGDRQGADKLRERAAKEAQTLRSEKTISAVERLARSNPASVATPDDFDADPMLLGTPGGVVDLCTGELRPARREDMITRLTAVTLEKGRPERWLRFLQEIFEGDAEVIGFMQRAAGYALTGMTTEHKLLFLYGTGRNGKSVLIDTLCSLWGDYARRAPATAFLNAVGEKHPTDIAGLRGARLVAGSELPEGKTWDEAAIKDLTGGGKMSARFMRGDFFQFDPQLTLMIAGNNMPSFRGVDEAIRARVVLVPFAVTIPPERRDRDLPAKLEEEEGGRILAWAIEGAVAWNERGLDVPRRLLEASAEYFDDEDALGQFLADETEADPGAFTTTTELHARFVAWCGRQGLTRWTLRALQKEVKARGFEARRRKDARGFVGLRLRYDRMAEG